MTVVLVGYYSGFILASLIGKDSGPPFHDLESLAKCIETRGCQLIHYSPSVAPLVTLFETPVEWLALGSMDSVNVISDGNQMMETLLMDISIYNVFWIPEIQFYAMAQDDKYCNYYVVHVGTQSDSFAFRKNSGFFEPFVQVQEKLRAYGIFQKIIET